VTRSPAWFAGVAGLVVATVLGQATPARAQIAPPAPTAIAVGDWQIAPVAEVRVRGEYRRDLDDLDQGTLLERTRLGVDAQDGPVEARVVLQDARALSLGDGPDPVGGPLPIAYTGAYEAWVEAHAGAREGTYVRLGRQPVVWGEGRLLGVDDWSPTGRSLDALRGRIAIGDADLEVLGAVLMDPATPDSLHSYGELAGLRAEWAVDPLLGFEAYGLARFAQDNPAASLGGTVRGETYTGALRVHGDAHAWTWGAEGAYQFGHADDLGVDRSAFAGAAHVGHELDDVVGQPTFGISGSYATGDRGNGTFGGFDPLLPDTHTWHGAMDLVAWSNEADVGASVHAIPWRDGDVGIAYRYLRLAQAAGAWTSGYLVTLGAAPGNTKADLGHEVDATVQWSPWTPVGIAVGYSLLAVGDGARTVLAANGIGAPDGIGVVHEPSLVHFAYAQVTVVLP
jgi:hypothetical protein